MHVTTRGLEDVVAAPSAICYIDGDKGILAYRGYDIHDLAEKSTFEETAFLLWFGRMPTRAELDDLRRQFIASALLPEPVLKLMSALPRDAAPMDVLRTAVSALGIYDADERDNSREANVRKAIRLVAQTNTMVAAFDRMRNGQAPLAPAADLSLAGNFLYMRSGERARANAERAFDIGLILQADHEFNASTFAARVTAATLTDMHSAVTSAIGTLKGPLHGGANEAVIRLLLEIGDRDPVAYIRDLMSRKVKIPGFGHRVYHTEDPRATHLRQLSRELCESAGQTKLYENSAKIEQFVKTEKHLNPNVDFYSATTFYSLGIRPDLFTPIFAISRMSGWTAHLLEQYADNRLIRPRAEYVGPEVPQRYVPIDQR